MIKKFKQPITILMTIVMLTVMNFSSSSLNLLSLIKTVYANEITAIQPTTGNGSSENPYQIATYENLIWFQQYVSTGNKTANAILTNHIVANKNLLNTKGELKGTPDYSWTPITSGKANSTCYSGTFDGNGYTISGLYYEGTLEGVGLFGYAKGTIKNLQILDSYFSGGDFTGSIVGRGFQNCVIDNCSSNATVKGASYCGGIAGSLTGSASNSYYAGNISSTSTSNIGAITNDAYGSITNCYYLDTCGLTSTVAKAMTADEFKSGKACYLLNNMVTDGTQAWYQAIGTNSYPVQSKTSINTVYPDYDLEEEKYIYTNTKYSCTNSGHKYVNGICKICDTCQEAELENNSYQIDNYGNLIWFQQYVNSGNKTANAILTNHIVANKDLLNTKGELKGTPDYSWTPITSGTANSTCYSGTFDGNGYTISGLYYEGTLEGVGLLGYAKGTIKNLQILDSYFSGGDYTGTIIGRGFQSCVIDNCSSNATIKGASYCGGIAGSLTGSVSNSYYAGNISSTSTSNIGAITNDAYGSITNCYYLDTCGLTSTVAKAMTADEFKSGKACYLLNNMVTDGTQAWYQAIGTNSYPVQSKTSANAVYRNYNSEVEKYIYTNTKYSCTDSGHKYVNGICVFCDTSQTPELENNSYQIDNYGNLRWFQQYVNSGNPEANAILTNHITANKNLLNNNGELTSTPDHNWAPITSGTTNSTCYSGTFDGNGYTISGLYYEGTLEGVGLFGYANGTIKNLQILDSYFKGGDYTGTIVGCGYQSCVINNCSSNATVKGASYCGGIAGSLTGSISNSYYAGNIFSTSTSNIGAITNDAYGSITNCYYLDTCGLTSTVAKATTADEFKSGEACYFLNNKVTDGTQAWYQTIGINSYPVQSKTSTTTVDFCVNVVGHKYENGICELCNSYQMPELKNNSYQIDNYGNLIWFQQYVNSGNPKANATLTSHITANKNLLDNNGELNCTPDYSWTPIDPYTNTTDCDFYSGTFDGNGYTISGLYCEGIDYVGLFGYANGTIKNLQILDSYFSGASRIGAIAAEGDYKCIIDNCSSNATVKGTVLCGGITGRMEHGTISNSYYAGNITSTISGDAMTGRPCENITNCYYLDTCGLTTKLATKKTADEFKSGEVCYLLNNGITDGTQVWYQTLNKDNYPVLSGNTVYYENTISKYYNGGTGDVNLDNTVNNTDVTLMLKYISGSKAFQNYEITIADVNKNGVVDMLDVISILNE